MLENQIYHIYNRGNNRESIFFEEDNYQFFLSRFRFYLKEQITVYAYCLMPNHFHFLLKVNELKVQTDNESKKLVTAKLSPLEKSFRDFFISYSKTINKTYIRAGSLFQYKFKRKLITDNAYLNNIVAYIHMNPVRAGLVNEAEDWSYSSYKLFLKDEVDILKIDKPEVINWFRGIDNFKDFHKIYNGFLKERDYLFN